MKRRRRLDKFPTPTIDSGQVLEDIRNREYLSKFKEFHVRTVFYLALLGMTDEQMAVVFDISTPTFVAWKNKFPTFLEAIKKGKEQADANMVYSLYQAGIGYEHESEQIFCSKEKIYDQVNGKTVLVKEVPKIIRAPFIKKYPPNVKAALRWLEVRQPAMWSARTDMNKKLGGPVQNNYYNLQGMTMEELKLLQKIGLQHAPAEDVGFTTTLQKELQETNL